MYLNSLILWNGSLSDNQCMINLFAANRLIVSGRMTLAIHVHTHILVTSLSCSERSLIFLSWFIELMMFDNSFYSHSTKQANSQLMSNSHIYMCYMICMCQISELWRHKSKRQICVLHNHFTEHLFNIMNMWGNNHSFPLIPNKIPRHVLYYNKWIFS